MGRRANIAGMLGLLCLRAGSAWGQDGVADDFQVKGPTNPLTELDNDAAFLSLFGIKFGDTISSVERGVGRLEFLVVEPLGMVRFGDTISPFEPTMRRLDSPSPR